VDVIVKTPPGAELVTLEEARLYLRVNGRREDAWYSRKLRELREEGEQSSQRSWLPQTLTLRAERWPGRARSGCDDLERETAAAEDRRRLWLPQPPVRAVKEVRYWAPGAADDEPTILAQDVDGSAVWRPLVGENEGAVVLVVGAVWPDLDEDRPLPVEVDYDAGWATAAAVPGHYRSAFELLLGSANVDREDDVSGKIRVRPGRSATTLLDERRIHPIG